jgi:hypothetical protein
MEYSGQVDTYIPKSLCFGVQYLGLYHRGLGFANNYWLSLGKLN